MEAAAPGPARGRPALSCPARFSSQRRRRGRNSDRSLPPSLGCQLFLQEISKRVVASCLLYSVGHTDFDPVEMKCELQDASILIVAGDFSDMAAVDRMCLLSSSATPRPASCKNYLFFLFGAKVDVLDTWFKQGLHIFNLYI
ncbi:uncharacterized protein GJ701_005690 [Geothlypis trichas]